ncbi:MAG: hypothetical protein K0S55_1208 [Clostridia bacterium]|nr:hypothetical protein [Clostridia bacterium]
MAMLSTEPSGSLEKDVGHGLNIDIKTNLIEGRNLYGRQGRGYGATCEMFFDYSDQSGVIILINGSNEGVNKDNFALVGEALIKEVYLNIIGKTAEIPEDGTETDNEAVNESDVNLAEPESEEGTVDKDPNTNITEPGTDTDITVTDQEADSNAAEPSNLVEP